MSKKYFILALVSFCFFGVQRLQAQLGFDLDIKKPEPYENRELKAEKTGDKKLKAPRRFMQNMTTHYNYFFNANARLNEIIDRAKESQQDNYSLLLPFYNYSLNTTAGDSALLDSVIAKAKTGIVLHDLRNDWIDNMYMLWGAAYYFQQHYDSAQQMFQFINYAFADKEADGYYKYIGSRIDGDKDAAIATKENSSLLKRAVSEPPSRNTAFIWQIRTMIQQKAFAEAGSLINILRNDPQFPSRLNGALEEVQSLWFYQQGKWDSAAYHLVKALGEAKNKSERARWEYLAGQLFENSGQYDKAKEYYSAAIGRTTDPVMEIYARLNLIRINKEGGDDYINHNIETLLKMARRDKYLDYRDVIYSMAAQMELQRGNFAAAQLLLLKASKYKTENLTASNNAYLQLAELAFARRDYQQAGSFYDSISITDQSPGEVERINSRKEILTRLKEQDEVITRQDSLQRIAAMPEGERSDYIRKLVRQIRRQQGLKEEEAPTAGRALPAGRDPFAATTAKGDWYFYNKNLKSAGSTAFQQLWGNRPNIDNWRRFTDVTTQLRQNTIQGDGRSIRPISPAPDAGPATFETLSSRLPSTPADLQVSNDSIRRSLETLGTIYINELEDYASAVQIYEEMRRRFPSEDLSADQLFQLQFSYAKTGDKARSEEIKKQLLEKYPSDRLAIIAATGKDPQSEKAGPELTKKYEGIYDLFVEGKFAEALAAKQQADSIYQTNQWSPQLLYIEAVYHVRQREDSIAVGLFNTLIRQNPGTPLASKAENLIEVLERRQEIEAELSTLEIERPVEDSLFVEPMPVTATVQKRDSVVSKEEKVVAARPVTAKPVAEPPLVTKPPVQTGALYSFIPDEPHYAVVVLNKVDPVFGNEARNAFNRHNKEKFYNQPLDVKQVAVNEDIRFLVVESFSNAPAAIDYIQKVKPVAATQIVPWLKGDKFSFTIISERNLKTLLGTKNFEVYKGFLDQNLPVKF